MEGLTETSLNFEKGRSQQINSDMGTPYARWKPGHTTEA